MKVPMVKEWGSWVVFFSSCLAALLAAFSQGRIQPGAVVQGIPTVSGLAMLVNSKNSLSMLIRSKRNRRENALWFLFFVLTGMTLLIPFLREGLSSFRIFSLLVFSYICFLSSGREHNLFSELNGFALLTLPAPVVYFVIAGEMSVSLYAAVFIYFAAGVLKVRMKTKKTMGYRLIMVTYCCASLPVFSFMNIPQVLLVPVIENIVSAVWMRNEKLRVTGYIEFSKSMVFLALVYFFW